MRMRRWVATSAVFVVAALVAGTASALDTLSTTGIRIVTVPVGTNTIARHMEGDAIALEHGSAPGGLWSGSGPLIRIGDDLPPGANIQIGDMNADLEIVGGYLLNGVEQAFVWSESGGAVDIPDPPGIVANPSFFRATGISNDGWIVGQYRAEADTCGFPQENRCGFLAIPSGSSYEVTTFQQPPPLALFPVEDIELVSSGGTDVHVAVGFTLAWSDADPANPWFFLDDGGVQNPSIHAVDVNRNGEIVGSFVAPGEDLEAAYWSSPVGQLTLLGRLPDDTRSLAHSISDASIIVGESGTSPLAQTAVFWTLLAQGPTDLGHISQDTQSSVAFGVNSDGVIVGVSDDDAVIWDVAGDHEVGEVIEIVPVPDQSVQAGFPLQLTFSSTGAQIPQYEVFSGAPPDLTPPPENTFLNSSTGQFTWITPFDQFGDHTLTVRVSDQAFPEIPPSHETFVVTVEGTPTETVTIVIDESILVIDDPTLLPAAFIQILETIGVSDDVTVRPPVSIQVIETIGVGDDVSVRPPVVINIFEDILVTDEPSLSPSVLLTIAEAIAVGDAVVVSPDALASVSGAKWEDSNGNALREAGEPALEGVTIYLDLDDDGILEPGEPTTTTASDGSYSFDNLVPGLWIIREVVPAGHTQTFPSAAFAFEHHVVLAAGEATDGLDFGNHPTPNLPPTIVPIDDVFTLVGQQIVVDPVIVDPEEDQITVSWEGGPGNAIINGIFDLTPTPAQGGSVFDITLTAEDESSNLAVETFSIFVVALPAVQGDQPTVNPVTAPPGGTIQVGGDGFQPGSTTGTYLFTDPVLLGTATVDIDGSFSKTVILPSDASSGDHHILVMGIGNDGQPRTLVVSFTITDDPDDDGLTTSEELLTGTNPQNPDTDGDGLIDGLDASWLIGYLDSLPNSHFKRRWHRSAMKLDVLAAALAVNLGNGDLALQITSLLHDRIDGCGSKADRNDWIDVCTSQLAFRQLLGLYERGVATLPLPDPFPWS